MCMGVPLRLNFGLFDGFNSSMCLVIFIFQEFLNCFMKG
jgi:hypothetical protein